MRRIALWITALIAVFSLSAVIAVQIGRRQPLPERVAMLHLTDCELPCWIGIVPGKTTVGEARERIKQIYPNLPIVTYTDEDRKSIVGYEILDGFHVQFIVHPDITDGSVINGFGLLLQSSHRFVSIAQLYSVFREPDIMWPGDGKALNSRLFFNRPQVDLWISHDICGKVTFDQMVSMIRVYPGHLTANELPSDLRRWHGFRICYNRSP